MSKARSNLALGGLYVVKEGNYISQGEKEKYAQAEKWDALFWPIRQNTWWGREERKKKTFHACETGMQDQGTIFLKDP